MEMDKPRWGLLEIVAVYIGIIAAGLVFGRYSSGVKAWLAGTGTADPSLAFFIIAYIFQFLATVLLVLVFTLVLNRARLKELGFRSAGWKDYIRYGILGGFMLMILIVALGLIMNLIHPDIEPQLFEEMLRSAGNWQSFIALLIIGSVLAPLSEELYYRGMIYPVFRSHLGPFWGAILAGVVFGAVHWDLWRAIPLAVGGALLCYIYEKSGSILVSALAHGIWNGIMAFIVYFSLINV
jgi:membrane protease YdiL (CAAX protease family)